MRWQPKKHHANDISDTWSQSPIPEGTRYVRQKGKQMHNGWWTQSSTTPPLWWLCKNLVKTCKTWDINDQQCYANQIWWCKLWIPQKKLVETFRFELLCRHIWTWCKSNIKHHICNPLVKPHGNDHPQISIQKLASTGTWPKCTTNCFERTYNMIFTNIQKDKFSIPLQRLV